MIDDTTTLGQLAQHLRERNATLHRVYLAYEGVYTAKLTVDGRRVTGHAATIARAIDAALVAASLPSLPGAQS